MPADRREDLIRWALRARRGLIVVATSVLALASYFAAFFVRADFTLPETWRGGIVQAIPFLIAARLLAFRHYGLLQGWWSGPGLHDFLDIVKSVFVGSAIFVTAVILAFGVYALPRSIVVIDATLLIGLLSGSRLLTRALGKRGTSQKNRRTLVVGRLSAMEPLVRDVVESERIPLLPVGLVDLDGAREGLRLHGVPLVGRENDLPRVLKALSIDTLLLVLSPRDGNIVRRILTRCATADVHFKIVPPLRHVLTEQLQVTDLRDLELDDLLGRSEVRMDVAGIGESLAGRRILITGAAGSIGSELARQVAAYGPERLTLLDRSDAPLAKLHANVQSATPGVAVTAVLCDICNPSRLRSVFEEHRPEIVYHAAAYKHVPMMEMNPVEAVNNNVLATRDLLDVADEFGVEKFVFISTDKAVRPINIMGATKRVAERLLEQPNGKGCRRIAVRFGNVLGSEGSVVPILVRQIRAGGPVTVTHPDATRYFMTIPEAVQLVLQAGAIGRGGETFVLEMGEPVRILDLATSLIRLAGLRPGRDIEIRITGLRPGERLHEETLIDSGTVATGIEKLWVRPPNGRSALLLDELAALEALVERRDRDAILEWLRRTAEGPTGNAA